MLLNNVVCNIWKHQDFLKSEVNYSNSIFYFNMNWVEAL